MLWFAAWAISAVGIMELFDRIDEALTPSARKRIARWLKGLEPARGLAPVAEQIASIFDTVFGERHRSWRCFLSSVVMSVFSMGLATVFSWSLNPRQYEFASIWEDWPLPVLWWTAVVSLFPNYMSLLETRWLMGQIAGTRTSLNTLGILLLGAGLAVVTAFVSVWLGFAAITLITFPEEASIRTMLNPSWGVAIFTLALLNQGPFYFLTICTWSAFAPGIWSVGYGVAALAVRLTHSATVSLRRASRWFDEKRPLRAVGLFVVLIWTVGIAFAHLLALTSAPSR